MLPSAKAVTDIQPQLDEIRNCPGRGIIVSGVSPSGSGFDFYSRFFCPKLGINEVNVLAFDLGYCNSFSTTKAN